MSLLAPALLAGLLAIAIPIIVHLVQREQACADPVAQARSVRCAAEADSPA